MDPFARRVFFSVSGILVVLLAGMLTLVWKQLNPAMVSMVSAPPPQTSNLQDFTPFIQIPGIHFSIYHTSAGETFQALAPKFNLLETTLRSLNQANDGTQPKADTPLFIPSKDGIFHLVRPGQGLADIARAYGLSLGIVLQANRKMGDSDLKPGEIL